MFHWFTIEQTDTLSFFVTIFNMHIKEKIEQKRRKANGKSMSSLFSKQTSTDLWGLLNAIIVYIFVSRI